jgi:hypothetical protein
LTTAPLENEYILRTELESKLYRLIHLIACTIHVHIPANAPDEIFVKHHGVLLFCTPVPSARVSSSAGIRLRGNRADLGALLAAGRGEESPTYPSSTTNRVFEQVGPGVPCQMFEREICQKRKKFQLLNRWNCNKSQPETHRASMVPKPDSNNNPLFEHHAASAVPNLIVITSSKVSWREFLVRDC